MNIAGLKKEIYNTGLFLYFEYLRHYGVDRYHTKKDLLILSCLDELLENNCYYELIGEEELGCINRFYTYIRNKNPQLKYCRRDIINYNNFGNAQYIEKFRVIDYLMEQELKK
jgi:hypothetical protein